MNHENSEHDNDVIAHMTQMILTEILEQVVNEFEKSTGTRIGRIHLAEPNRLGGRRRSEIEIHCAGRDCLDGLMKYKKLLCEHDMFPDSGFCAINEDK